VPRSRRYPRFSAGALAAALAGAGIGYLHEPALGGLRTPRRDSVNGAWKNEAFRGFADHMQTPEFDQALDAIISLGREHRLALMCAEGSPTRCHRSLIADALLARAIQAWEITTPTIASPHQLTTFALVVDGRVSYPPPSNGDQ
jgi:uncharacterized protein (DUF488 family)